MRLCSFYLFLRSSHRPERCVRKDHVVSVQGSGLVGLLLKVLSGTDWFWRFSWKTLPKADVSWVFILILAPWADSPCHSWFLVLWTLFSFPQCSVPPWRAVVHHVPLLKPYPQPGSLSCCLHMETNKKSQPSQVSLILVCENAGATAGPDTVWAKFRQDQSAGRFYSEGVTCIFLVCSLPAIIDSSHT